MPTLTTRISPNTSSGIARAMSSRRRTTTTIANGTSRRAATSDTGNASTAPSSVPPAAIASVCAISSGSVTICSARSCGGNIAANVCSACANAKICGRFNQSAISPTGSSSSTARGARRASMPKLSTPATSTTSTMTIVSVRWKSSVLSAPTSSVPIPPPPTAPTMIDARIAHSNAYVPNVSRSAA